jgi:allantoinase
LTGITTSLVPDVLNYSWRDYGPRVGVWRMMDVLAKHGVKVAAALNSDVCHHYPELIKAGNEQGWEWMAHGKNNSPLFTKLAEDDERKLIKEVIDTIHQATGKRSRGWLLLEFPVWRPEEAVGDRQKLRPLGAHGTDPTGRQHRPL